MNTFRCPECKTEVRTIGTSVYHSCRGKMREWELIKIGEKS